MPQPHKKLKMRGKRPLKLTSPPKSVKPTVYEKLMSRLREMIGSYASEDICEHTTMVAEDAVEYGEEYFALLNSK